MTAWTVRVNALEKTLAKGVVAEASAGGTPEGPPMVRFSIPSKDVESCYIGKEYTVTIEEKKDGE